MTLEVAIQIVHYYLRFGHPQDTEDFNSALRITLRAVLIVQHLKEVIDLCGDLYKTTP